MPYAIRDVNGIESADIIHRFNRMAPETFPELERHHLEQGHWWLACCGDDPVGFAGLVPFVPFPHVGYLKRAFVLHAHRGHGLQQQFLTLREARAKQLGWSLLVSECSHTNGPSARNFERAGYSTFEPEQRWGAANSVYWQKQI